VRLINLERLQRLLAVTYRLNLETFPLQSVHEHLLERRLVVYQKYLAGYAL
jgi:hypothetical protein